MLDRKSASFLLLAAAGLVAFLASAAWQDSQPVDPTRRSGPHQCEPLVVYDKSGGTLTGPVHCNLIVYNNGQVALADFGFPGQAPRNLSKRIPAEQARALSENLQGLGAFELQDQPQMVMDVPLTSVTVFRGGTDAQAHTFNYFLAHDGFARIQEALDGFIAATFPQD